ncbi:MAG: sarcosine oxidase subunit gamma [Steroidobacterales bacterium]
MFEARSALARFNEARDGAGGAQLRLAEVRGWHLAHLTAFSAHSGEFTRCLALAFGADPPADLYRGITHGNARLVRLTRDQYWWIAGDDTGLRRLAQELPPSAGAVTTLSAARVRLRVEGPAARDMLAKGIAIDLHPAVFAVGHSAQTGLHHNGIFVERVAADAYELFVPRTFAASIWEWLMDAALPYGVTRE